MIPYLSKIGLSLNDLKNIPYKLFVKMCQRFIKNMESAHNTRKGIRIATQEDMDRF